MWSGECLKLPGRESRADGMGKREKRIHSTDFPGFGQVPSAWAIVGGRVWVRGWTSNSTALYKEGTLETLTRRGNNQGQLL